MVRWRERCRAAKAAPFPDHVPKGASTANKWAYIHVSPAHGATRPESEHPGDPETVMVLFDRYDKRRHLTRLLIEALPLDEFPNKEKRRARKSMNHFVRELCHRGLLLHPRKSCIAFGKGQCPRFPRQDWTGK